MQGFQFGAAQFVFDPAGRSGTLIKFSLPALQLMVAGRGQLPADLVWRAPGIYFRHHATQGILTPENTLRRDLRQESLRDSARVVQVGPSTFALPSKPSP